MFKIISKDILKHYGTPGQKWGERNWQNPDGSYNDAGFERYYGKPREEKKVFGIFKRNKYKEVEKRIRDEMAEIMLNKYTYANEQEYFNRINALNFEKAIFESVKPQKKKLWIKKFFDTFSDTSSRSAGEKVGKGVVDLIIGKGK